MPSRHSLSFAPSPLDGHNALYTDLYELTMAQGYWRAGKADESACFDYFFRSNPFDGGFTVFSGVETLLHFMEAFEFDEDDLSYLEDQGLDPDFLATLDSMEMSVSLEAPSEGELVFPQETIVRVEGPLLQAQLLETALLNILNFESLIATKAARMRLAAGDRSLIDFGLRRAQGFGGIQASRAAISGGFDATSNVHSAFAHGLDPRGTQAHAWIQSFETELDAFRAYARTFPDATILLVDTYDTLDSGVPNAIQVARELEEQGHQLVGIRLDSGDLAYLSKRAREMLDEAGFEEVKIAASNQLDEHVIHSLLRQDAPIDVFGVGTQLVTAYDDAALDGVYKLAASGGEHRLKLSENPAKVNLPGRKQVLRLIDDEGKLYGDAICLAEEDAVSHMFDPEHPRVKNVTVEQYEQVPLLKPLWSEGEAARPVPDAVDTRSYVARQLDRLPDGHKRRQNPHIYKVGLSQNLLEARDHAIDVARQRNLES